MHFEPATREFEQWLARQNITISPKVAIADLRHQFQGRGLVATEDIVPEEELFSIPRSSILNVENSQLLVDKPDIRDNLLALTHWEQLTIVLLYELEVLKSKSRWVPYFNVLPIKDTDNLEFNQLMFWTDAELKLLSPSLIVERVGKDVAEGVYEKLFPAYVSQQLQLPELAEVTLQTYNQVASIIMSYSFDVEKFDPESNGDSDEPMDMENAEELLELNFFKSMIPLADTLNADTKLHNASLVYTPDSLVMIAIKPIPKGNQIYNTYSDHPNSEILRRYGYVEWNGSEHDFGEVPLSLIKDYFVSRGQFTAKYVDELLSIMSQIVDNDESGRWADIVLDSYDCFVSREVIIEFIFIIQVLTVLASINSLNSMEHLSDESKYQLVSRVFKKCYKLIESGKLTKCFEQTYKDILDLRLKQYPKAAAEEFTSDPKHDRASLAMAVLRSEYKSFKTCSDTNAVFRKGDVKYSFISDEAFIKSIVNKKFLDELH
ncbi:hypothetical protein PGUG_03343 [Meyerozyma guilliermondii ATCC 6260]|uniref:Ribosomal lysine N-methyltransferase 4 n=1 Tax=Meyerozyma guilliermondii (strain ATCC 6260 / CBS 566 / DSM 6381 / JCM 1539 / NBRC 10279 / NRRL Y-324) TaxID=294746 RepID=A5DJ92_PICGU|nr:uncharacterized protein PGUG_03343 [Meyerozyma guilliermondii ATCC 6260]EDK39245.2 hypothetical protein PGUG_03343 [Meyerozyma guilliermondii ATCC 6260]